MPKTNPSPHALPNRDLSTYFPIATGFAKLFSPHVEVVIHDLRTNTIAFIANPISKRKVGDSSLGDQFPEAVVNDAEVIGPYRKVNRDGRNLRSITSVIRDNRSKAIAVMCVNFDVTPLETIAEQVKVLAFLPGSLEPSAPFFHDNWRQALERAVEQQETSCGKSIRALDTNGRAEFVLALERAGLLSVRNAPGIVADRLGISRAALYKYMKAVRS